MSMEIEHSESDTLFHPNSRRVNRIESDTSSDNEDIGNNQNNGKVGRKRTRNPEKWYRNVEKLKRIQGKQYQNRNKRIIPAKKFNNKPCNCLRLCNRKITSSQRKQAMKNFYKLNDHHKQNIFLSGLIRVHAIKRQRPRNNTKGPKTQSFEYFIRLNGQDVGVCKKYFKETLVWLMID